MFSFGLNIDPGIVCCLDMPKNKNRHSIRNSALTLNDEYWISIRDNRADYYIGLFCTYQSSLKAINAANLFWTRR